MCILYYWWNLVHMFTLKIFIDIRDMAKVSSITYFDLISPVK